MAITKSNSNILFEINAKWFVIVLQNNEESSKATSWL